MKTTVIKFGIYGLIFAIVIFLGALYFGQELSYSTQEVLGYTSMIVSLIFVFFGIKHFRDRENEGRVNFGKALIIGLLISLITAVGFGIADYIYTTAINPNFFEEYEIAMRNQGYKGEIPEFTSGLAALLMFATVTILGLIISIISALILQKK
ncbi:DUF4199 domain-containing protein [Lentiprolixibacter aurantiacus]|uniref:DUF4199 domain-containing protein n=1 Tax=Lentiprolixibacter aurantiacus TaxID=2993939 RepID=A0AAE3MK78_9FLAO|nr:DUF4199 domain-containing protein [Lentiprolixibacter aurantiacus]MCX2718851.1 DUF4199 domain-containing protein [Lentiprolixibacter aurantiacus]